MLTQNTECNITACGKITNMYLSYVNKKEIVVEVV